MTNIQLLAKLFMFVLMLSSTVGSYLSGQARIDENTPVLNISSPNSTVPLVVKFNATVRDLNGLLATGTQNITFTLYKSRTGGDPLWSETQIVSPDSQGRFVALLGSVSSLGIPASVFATGGPQWVAITPNDGIERSRIELVSVPYALKAADADTLGGKRPDEFVSIQQLSTILSGQSLTNPGLPIRWFPLPSPFGQQSVYEATTPTGPSFISVATAGSPLQIASEVMVPHLNVDLLHGLSDAAFAKLSANNSFLAKQSFSAGLALPASNPDANIQGALDSAPLDFESSSLDPQTKSSVKQVFQWVSQPISGASTGPIAQLSLLFGAAGATPTNTGLSINSDGTINFAPGQQSPSGVVTVSGTGTGTTNPVSPTAPIVNTANYPWTQTPSTGTALQAGPSTVTLTPCPRGVNGTDLWHYLYISGSGTPEAVLITGGSCTSRAATGTIEFTTSYSHPVGYSIGTATAGVQEAVVDASTSNTAGTSRQVMVDPGSHIFRARLSIRGTGMTLASSGATITCAMSDACIMMGDPANANIFASITVTGLRVAPGVQNGTWPAVEDNANGSTVAGLAPAAGATGATFGSLIQIDNDQAATVDHLNTVTNYSWGRCDTTFCSTAVIGPGPYSKDAGVLTIQDSNITLQGVGNGIDNQNGNTLKVINSEVQGYSQFGIRATTVYQPTTVNLSGVYFEDDSDANPLGTGSAGLIVEGGGAVASGTSPAGVLPQFASTGSAQYFYYIVVNSSTGGTSPLYLAGYANTSGFGSIKVVWNEIGSIGVVTYDVLRIVGPANSIAPYGTGAFAVATGVPVTACANKVCSIIDNAATPAFSYTIHQNGYWPSLKLWPGSIILTTATDFVNSGGGVPTEYFTDSLSVAGIVSSAGSFAPSVFAQQCNPQSYWTPIWVQCVGGNAVSNDNQSVGATLLQQSGNGGNGGGLKGRLIFEIPPFSSLGPTEIVTLGDSNVDKTMATPGNRATWDSNDTFLGVDQPGALPSKMQLAFGAPVSVSGYVGNVPDGVHYLERLSALGKVFKVPLQVKQVSTGTVANTDVAGTLVISGETSSSYTFVGTYQSPPSCSLTPLDDTSQTGAYWATLTNTTLTANIKVPGNISFSYQCWGHDLYVQ